ncbi:Two-component system sensor ATPase [Burkholderiales bacterium]|nr:Two-component system sensor ATPase [Burkholderiales bacterium]
MPETRQLIPDGCNAGTVLRIGVGINVALAIAVLGGRAADVTSSQVSRQYAAAFLDLAAVVEPTTLLTLLGWCLLRRAGGQVAEPLQRALAWLLPAATAYGINRLAVGSSVSPLTRADLIATLLGLLGGMAAQHYLELRARAFSPAIDEAKFQALQSRIRPHFFFNSLNAVLAVIREDPLRAERMLESVAELFRAVMGDVKRLVPLEQELDLCRRYVEIEQTRLGDRLQVQWNIGAVHPRARVPQLLLQPIIENAVRYGAERLAGECDIQVRVRQQGFKLEIFVSNPIAREPVQREGNQIGLNNIRGRLALVYDLEASLETKVRRERFELTLTIPVETKTAA